MMSNVALEEDMARLAGERLLGGAGLLTVGIDIGMNNQALNVYCQITAPN
jgi:hypothetical protein